MVILSSHLLIPNSYFIMRVLAIDYGRKRCGVAVTDPLQIAANPLPVVRSCDLLKFLQEY